MPSSIRPQFKSDRTVKTRNTSSKRGNLIGHSAKDARDGSIRLSRDLDRLTLDVKKGEDWYEVRMRPKNWEYYTYSSIQHRCILEC